MEEAATFTILDMDSSNSLGYFDTWTEAEDAFLGLLSVASPNPEWERYALIGMAKDGTELAVKYATDFRVA